MDSPIVEIVSFLFWLFATFSTYYLICYATSANIDALDAQLLLIERYLQIDPTSTPSWTKRIMFQMYDDFGMGLNDDTK